MKFTQTLLALAIVSLAPSRRSSNLLGRLKRADWAVGGAVDLRPRRGRRADGCGRQARQCRGPPCRIGFTQCIGGCRRMPLAFKVL